MSWTGPGNGWRTSLMVSPFSKEGAHGSQSPRSTNAPASTAYAAVNRAYYYPVTLPSRVIVHRLWWLNGATASTNDFQVGLYLPDGTAGVPGTALIRGTATTASGANVVQFDDITDTAVPAGRYWLAIWGSGTTATLFRASSTVRIGHMLESSLTGGLPATATPAGPAGNVQIYVFGLSCRSSP